MTVFVLMTALPPTKGHLRLAQFASRLGHAKIIVCTQPSEPFADVRYHSLRMALGKDFNGEVIHLHEEVNQDPLSEGFWEYWRQVLVDHGAKPNDIVVSSEAYGRRLAEEIKGTFFPYDPGRDIYRITGTAVRNDPARYIDDVIPEFQKYMRLRVTLFGAESTGKTTLSKMLADRMNGWWLMEWARPYLELNAAPPITTEVMRNIWRGQQALQDEADTWLGRPWIIQDTDLFSTVGYWGFWDMKTPLALKWAAGARKSDLYLITQSNIPFEQDPIRYGGDKRESDDQYWIDLCERECLPYYVLQSETLTDRLYEAQQVLEQLYKERVTDKLAYQRFANDGTYRVDNDPTLVLQ